MYISRPSDPRTVLLWGDRWWFPESGESCTFAELAQAAEVLAEHFAAEPKPMRLRLVYQPDAFESVAVACPPGDRRLLGSALAGDFPALANPDFAWSHEPVLPAGEEHSTILHFETEPALLALATRLAQLGLAVVSAWPLASFLHALPDEWSESGGATIVALQAERAVAYRHPKDGGRSVQLWHGDSTLAQVGQWLAAIFAEDTSETVLLVTPEPETAGALESYLPPAERPGLEFASLGNALGRRVIFPRYHPAQLLPRGPAVTVQRMLIAASVALFLAAGWAGFSYGRDWRAARMETAHRESSLTVLRTEVAHLRENAAEIQSLRRVIAGGAAGPPCGEFLRALSATMPPEAVLTSLRLAGRSIDLSGWVAPNTGAPVIDHWRDRLAPSTAPWTVAIRTAPSGAITLAGVFRP